VRDEAVHASWDRFPSSSCDKRQRGRLLQDAISSRWSRAHKVRKDPPLHTIGKRSPRTAGEAAVPCSRISQHRLSKKQMRTAVEES
jgi:hypothetical protein